MLCLYTILYIIYAFVFVFTIIGLLMENRSPIRTLGWLLVLILLPAIGMLLYYIFGQDTRKMKHISHRYYKRVKKLSFDTLIKNDHVIIHKEHLPLVKMLQKSNNSAIAQGSDIEMITTGTRKFEALYQDIEQAKHHIHMEYFIFYNDQTGRKVKEMLMRKAAEGVEVRLLYDNVANWMVLPRFYNEMAKAGVQVSSFMKVSFPLFRSKVNYRNHRKVVVIDGQIGYMGGMNIGDDYAIDPNWRDTHMRITGNGVHSLQANFLIDWYSSGRELIEDRIYFPPCVSTTYNLMQIATGGPVNPFHNLLQATIYVITNAKKYLYIQTPYFLPSEALLEALNVACMGGIDVRLMLPGKSDMPIVNPAAHSYYEELLKVGIRIYELTGKVLHAKTMVSDDFISVVGSANLDFRSLETNFEINAYLYDEKLAKQNKQIFLDDMLHCHEIKLSEWEKRPWYIKLWESMIRILSPAL